MLYRGDLSDVDMHTQGWTFSLSLFFLLYFINTLLSGNVLSFHQTNAACLHCRGVIWLPGWPRRYFPAAAALAHNKHSRKQYMPFWKLSHTILSSKEAQGPRSIALVFLPLFLLHLSPLPSFLAVGLLSLPSSVFFSLPLPRLISFLAISGRPLLLFSYSQCSLLEHTHMHTHTHFWESL